MIRKRLIYTFIMIALLFAFGGVFAQEDEDSGTGSTAVGAALSVGLAAIGAGYAVAKTGEAAIATVSEKPELFGKSIVFVGLAEGIAIYGLIIAFMML